MDVALISSPVDEALEKLEEYLTAPSTPVDTEYQRIADAYKQLTKGTPLIVLSDVIANAPRDALARPMLAISRADQAQIKYERFRPWSTEQFQSTNTGRRRALETQGLRIGARIIDGVTPAFPKQHDPNDWQSGFVRGYSLVPVVPPNVRRRGNGPPRTLNTHFVLWEVEAWADEPIRANPDRDPYLLQRISGDLFAVVGEWDLTDVERAIMRDRALRR